MSSPLIAPIYKSVIRATVDLIAELNALGDFSLITYHNWESRGDENALPKNTLLGIEGFSFDKNKGLWLVRYALGLSSHRDQNLINEIEIVDEMEQRMGEGNKIKLRNLTSGNEVNELVVTEFQVMPMGQSEIRNYRVIGMELNRTGVSIQ